MTFQAIFEITTKLNIYWRKLMWNCETRGSDSVIRFHKITSICSEWIFILIFLPLQKPFGLHFIVFTLLNRHQILDYHGDFEIKILAIKILYKKKYIFFYNCETSFSFMKTFDSFISSYTYFMIFFVVKIRVFLDRFLKKMRFQLK